MATPPHVPFSAQLDLSRLGENVFETKRKPQRMGNPLPIAYGGYALSVACKAGGLTVPDGYYLYSIQGNYLGPAYTDRQLRATVRVIRQTRTFATRQVEVSQMHDDGQARVCLIAIADFQVQEKGVVLEYSRAPSQRYRSWRECPTQAEAKQQLLSDGKVSQQLLDQHTIGFSPISGLFDQRVCPEGIFAQNVGGMAKSLPHTQDSLPLAHRSTGDWFRSRESFPSQVENKANLAWMMDAAISFTPLGFSHLWFEDVGAVGSLDFSLRFFQAHVDAARWHLRELVTRVGGEGRSYGESWLWDEAGKAVACMTQQCILRPPHRGGKL